MRCIILFKGESWAVILMSLIYSMICLFLLRIKPINILLLSSSLIIAIRLPLLLLINFLFQRLQLLRNQFNFLIHSTLLLRLISLRISQSRIGITTVTLDSLLRHQLTVEIAFRAHEFLYYCLFAFNVFT